LPGSRYPNPLGSHNNLLVIDEGTSARTASPKPSPVGPPPSRSPKPHGYRRISSSGGRIPTLSKGVQGDYVRWLQILLNLHYASKPPLKPDGYFGPKTLEAVLKFQHGSGLKADGVVGLKTWTKVQLIQAELPQSEPEGAATQHYVAQVQAPAAPAPPSIADWSLTRRFLEVVTVLVPRHLGPELAAQFRAMLTPKNIAILVATLTAWAVSHAFGVGEAVDLILTVVGVIFMGMAVFKAGRDIGECLVITVDAKEYSDLDKAGDRLAEAIVIIGVVAFFALIARVAAKLRRSGGVPEDEQQDTGNDEDENGDERDESQDEQKPAAKVDPKVQKTLDSVDQTGKAPPGQVGGRQFMNDGRGGGETLPKTDAQGNPVEYREWDVNPKQPGVNRGPERLVTGSDGSAYYTSDHYQSFTQIR